MRSIAAKKRIERHLPHGNIERRQTEFATERAAARRFDVDHAMRDVFIGVILVRQPQIGERRRLASMILSSGRRPASEPFAQSGKLEVGFAGHREIGEPHDLLLVVFVADFRPAEHDDQLRREPLEQPDEFRRRRDIPDVDAQAENARSPRKNRFGNVDRPLRDVELGDLGSRLQITEIGEQIAQPERTVGVAGIQRAQDNVGHWDRSVQVFGHFSD